MNLSVSTQATSGGQHNGGYGEKLRVKDVDP